MKSSKLADKVNGFLKQGGWGELDERNTCHLKKGNGSLAVAVIPDRDLLLISSPVITLPEENLLPLFRKLLMMNLSETQDAAFALNAKNGRRELSVKCWRWGSGFLLIVGLFNCAHKSIET